jgi:hypothetical protein
MTNVSAEELAALDAPAPPVPPKPPAPAWTLWPEDMPALRPGKNWWVFRFSSAANDDPGQRDLVAIVWGLTVADERQANTRTFGNSNRLMEELTKQTIHWFGHITVDGGREGEPVNWATPHKVEDFWERIGPKYRSQLTNHFLRISSLSDEERLDFLVNCIVQH